MDSTLHWLNKSVFTFGNVFLTSLESTLSKISEQTMNLPYSSYFLYMYVRLRFALKTYEVPWKKPLPAHPMEERVSTGGGHDLHI